MKNIKLITKYALDVSINTLDRLDTIAKLENIENGWDEEKYFSFDPVNENTWIFNFYGNFENIRFSRIENTNYFQIVE